MGFSLSEEFKMEPFHECINEYRKQLKKGYIQVAYKGLMEYIMGLRSYLKTKYPDYILSGSIYHGYMDMTYFSFFTGSLKSKKLKTGIVFNYGNFRFEVWLFGYNKNVQNKYWNLFKAYESYWKKYHIPVNTKGVDSIMEYILVDNPDFNDLDTLTEQIEKGTLEFIDDVENFLSKH